MSPSERVPLPRQQLYAALLLAEVMEFTVTNVFVWKVNEIFAWSYSIVGSEWIRSSSHRRETFVTNRVFQIQEKVPPEHKFYEDGNSNLADCTLMIEV